MDNNWRSMDAPSDAPSVFNLHKSISAWLEAMYVIEAGTARAIRSRRWLGSSQFLQRNCTSSDEDS